jgi:GNAT superfamily N-acetyltransferase
VRRHLADPAYTDWLQQLAMTGAWIDGVLVGTCGWAPGDDSGQSARIEAAVVAPLFVRLGVGAHLVRSCEADAAQAGFTSVGTRVVDAAVPFFRALGYEVTSHGVSLRAGELPLPVTFLRRHLPPLIATRASARPAASNGVGGTGSGGNPASEGFGDGGREPTGIDKHLALTRTE